MPETLIETAQIFWKYQSDGYSTEKLLQNVCGPLNFPKNELRVRQILKISKVIPEFQEILLKGLHSLDYLALLGNCSPEDQKYFYEKWVKPHRLNYNTQKKIFEWLYDLADRDHQGSIQQAIERVGHPDKLFAIRFPSSL